MPKQPVVSGREAVRALERGGFVVDRQHASHVTMRHHGKRRTATVPVHANEDLPPGTLRGVLRQAGLTLTEFVELLG